MRGVLRPLRRVAMVILLLAMLVTPAMMVPVVVMAGRIGKAVEVTLQARR